ncbi:uncharacterized protein LOC130048215 [Ostrea edulis]|uniref:uncharacterized protein LOC130048215 n=1 Tax=Ostrea edulis TaxID=37623 RepID=UPI0024AEA520|nr:uncharacterized protein LOC130048215 [Ostrea edulis]
MICDLSVENERIRSEKKEFENEIFSLKKQEAGLQQLAKENLSLRRSQDSVQELEEKLGQVREEKKTLQTTMKSMTSQVESLQQEKQCLEDRLGKIQEKDYTSDKRLEHMAAKLSDFESNYNKRENDFKAVMEQKGKLEAIVRENNTEIKELERLLSETRAECEDLKSDAKKQISEQLSSRQKEHEAAFAEMKMKIREKDHSLRDSNKQIRHLENEMKNLVKKSESKDAEMKTWKAEKDKLVSALSEIIEKQREDKERVQDLESEKSRLEALVEDHIQTIRQLTASGSSVKKSGLRSTCNSSDVSMLENNETPLRRTSTRRGRKRRSYSMSEVENPVSKKKDSHVSLLSEDVGDDRARIHIDATPPVAAKTLRRTRKKHRSSTDLLREEAKDSSKSKVDMADKENKTVKRIGSLLSVLKKSPISRSAKKNLAGIKEVASPNQNLGSSLVEVEDCGTQMSAEKNKEPPSRKKSRRHALYKEPLTISEPLDCGQFINTTPEENVHDTVQKRLRRRPRK